MTILMIINSIIVNNMHHLSPPGNHRGRPKPRWERFGGAISPGRRRTSGTNVWLTSADVPGRLSSRGLIERNVIALLSNCSKRAIDAPLAEWLGNHCDRERVRQSRMWNNNHVDERCDARFLSAMGQYVECMVGAAR